MKAKWEAMNKGEQVSNMERVVKTMEQAGVQQARDWTGESQQESAGQPRRGTGRTEPRASRTPREVSEDQGIRKEES